MAAYALRSLKFSSPAGRSGKMHCVKPSGTLRFVGLFVIVVALSAVFERTCSAQQCEDNAIKVDVEQHGDEVTIFATMQRLLEGTICVDAKLNNMVSNAMLPVTRCLNGAGRVPVAAFRRADQNKDWSYTYHYQWQKGLLDPAGDFKGQYVVCYLPYPPGEAYRVNQGFFGKISHFRGSSDEYGVDFGLPEGSTVCAALGGVVVAVRDDSSVGGADPRFRKCANYIVIKHADGTYAEYGHLRQAGVLVKLGQQVSPGMPIGFSGHTGHADAPHLHFDVYKVGNGAKKVTLPVYFKTSAGLILPREGDVYQNK